MNLLICTLFLGASAFTYPNAGLSRSSITRHILPPNRLPTSLNVLPEVQVVLSRAGAEAGSVDLGNAVPAIIAGSVIAILLAGLPVIFVTQDKSAKKDDLARITARMAKKEGIEYDASVSIVEEASLSPPAEVSSEPQEVFAVESSTEPQEAKQRGTI